MFGTGGGMANVVQSVVRSCFVFLLCCVAVFACTVGKQQCCFSCAISIASHCIKV